MGDFARGLAGIAVLGLLFSLIERRWPVARRRSLFAPGRLRELGYWLLSMTVVRGFVAGASIVLVLIVARALGAPHDDAAFGGWLEARSHLRGLPRPIQVAVTLVVIDFGSYWLHRLMHGPRALWKIHAVHHATTELDWFSAARVHPLGEAIDHAILGAAVIATGFDPRVLAFTAPLFGAFAIFLHANVRLRFGALRFVIATPAFHRWHHAESKARGAREDESLSGGSGAAHRVTDAPRGPCNFAAMLPIWDLIFGTFYLPEHAPERLGANEPAMPETITGQLLFPFRGEREDGVTP